MFPKHDSINVPKYMTLGQEKNNRKQSLSQKIARIAFKILYGFTYFLTCRFFLFNYFFFQQKKVNSTEGKKTSKK